MGTGVLEIGVLGVLKAGRLLPAPAPGAPTDHVLRHGFLWLSPHVVWITPLALAVVLSVLGLALAAAGSLRQRGLRAEVVLGAMLLVSFAELLTVYPGLHGIAVAVLATGAAAQATRVVRGRWQGWQRAVRRAAGPLAAAVTIVAMGMGAWTWGSERFRLSQLPAAAAGAPNVLFIIWDTVRAGNLSLYGYDRRTTPRLEALARRAVVFDRAHATAPWTLPSHVSAFTGLWPYEFTANWLRPYEGEETTLAERLARAGYATAGFVANLLYMGRESGLRRGFAHYEDYRLTPTEFVVSTALGRRLGNAGWVRRLLGFHDVINREPGADVTDSFLAWLDARGDRPFFAFLNYLDAHEPYMPPPPYDERFGPATLRHHERNVHQLRAAVRLDREQMSPAEAQAQTDAYDGAIAYLDDQLGRILDELERRGLDENTVVIVASDHGEQFGEHGLFAHGNSLYLPLLDVPLVVAFGDRVPGGTRVPTPVSLRDLPATVLDLLGVRDGTVPGASLVRFWNGGAPAEEVAASPVFAEFTDIKGTPTAKSILVGRYHYIWGERLAELLYDVVSDPGEQHNLMRVASQDLLTRVRRVMGPHILNDGQLWERLDATE